MRFLLIALFSLAFLSASIRCNSQTISGQVISAKDSSDIPFATVYIPNTTEGVITDEKGKFNFEYSPKEQFDLVASHTAYIAHSILIVASSKNTKDIYFLLAEKSIELDEVVVKPNQEEWQMNYSIFLENIFSNTESFGIHTAL